MRNRSAAVLAGLVAWAAPARADGPVKGAAARAAVADPAGNPPGTAAVLVGGPLGLPTIAALDLTYASTTDSMANAIRFGTGNRISYHPQLSFIDTPDVDHQRTSALFSATTQDDGHSEEQTVAIETTVTKGFRKTYGQNKAYAAGDNVVVGDAVWRAIRAGTTGPKPVLPNDRPDTVAKIADGTVTWMWINDSAIDAKVGLANEVAVLPGGGQSWGMASNLQLQPGMTPSFNIGLELDLTNASGTDCQIAVADCNNLYVATGGDNQNTTGVAVTTGNSDTGEVWATHWGLRLNGQRLASDADIEDDAGAPVGLGFGASGIGGGSHAEATIKDASAGPVSFLVAGNHAVASFQDLSSSPASIAIGGAHALAAIRDTSASPTGLALGGSYAVAQIAGTGFRVSPTGGVTAAGFAETLTTPTSSAMPCAAGQFTDDANYHYVCTSTNHWRRAALSDF